jgi:hypothetical protein
VENSNLAIFEKHGYLIKMWLLYLAITTLVFWQFFVVKRPKNYPPGPWFKLPMIGQNIYHVFDGRIEGNRKLRKKCAEN